MRGASFKPVQSRKPIPRLKLLLPEPLIETCRDDAGRNLHRILSSVFTKEQAQNLERIITKKRYSTVLIEKRLNQLRKIMGKEAFPILMRRSPSAIYSGSSGYSDFKKKEMRDAKARKEVFRAFSEAGVANISGEARHRIILNPKEVLEGVSHIQKMFKGGWKKRFQDIAGEDCSFFLKSPCYQKDHIDHLSNTQMRREQAHFMKCTLISGLSDLVSEDEAKRLVKLYVLRIKSCSLETALKRLDVFRSLGEPDVLRKLDLPWAKFFGNTREFDSFIKKTQSRLRAPKSKRTCRAQIKRIVGAKACEEIVSRCSCLEERRRARSRLRMIEKNYGPKFMQTAANETPYIFTSCPAHFKSWLAGLCSRNAEKGEKKNAVLSILIEVFGESEAPQRYQKRTLSHETVLSRVAYLKQDFPEAWTAILKSRPSSVLSVSKKKFENEVRSYLYESNAKSQESEMILSLGKFFDESSVASVLERRKKRRLSAEGILERLSELGVLRDASRKLVPRSCAWVLTVEDKKWYRWLGMRKMRARVISLIKEHDFPGAKKRIEAVALTYKTSRLKKMLFRLDALEKNQGRGAVADVLRFNWIALANESDARWKGFEHKNRYLLVPINKTIERVAHEYRLAINPLDKISKTGRLFVCPEARLCIRIFGFDNGELTARHADLKVLNLHMRLFCLKNKKISKREAVLELERLKTKNPLKLQERMMLWMIRSYAMQNPDITLANALDAREFQDAFDKGLPIHPDYGAPPPTALTETWKVRINRDSSD